LCMQQDAACFVETTADANPGLPTGDARHTGQVRLTFLKSKVDNNDYDPHNDQSLLNTDLIWTQWSWQQSISALCNGSSSTARFWQENGSWKKGGQDFAAGKYFMNLPLPRRAAGVNAVTTLNNNTFTSGDPQDIGDYDDVTNNLHPVSRGITRFDLEVVLADGTVIDPSVSTTAVYPYDGDYVDGHVPATGTPPHLKRPRLFRIRFDITDFELHFTQTFSFSFPAPGSLSTL